MSFTSPWVSHLLFADDSLIFMSAEASCAHHQNDILCISVECFGQAVSREKSVVYFSPNTPPYRGRCLNRFLGSILKPSLINILAS